MTSSERGNCASVASRNAASTWLAISCTRLSGKLEGNVPTMTAPSRSTVKLPEGSFSNVGAGLEKSVRKPIRSALSWSFPALVQTTWNVSIPDKIQYRRGSSAKHVVADRGPGFPPQVPHAAGRPDLENVADWPAPIPPFAPDSPNLWPHGCFVRRASSPAQIQSLQLGTIALARAKPPLPRPPPRRRLRLFRPEPGRSRAGAHCTTC